MRKLRHRCEVAHREDDFQLGVAATEEGEDAVISIIGIDPMEAGRVAVVEVERRLVAVKAVEVGDEPPDAGVALVVGEAPVDAGVVGPFAPLADLAAHEQQLLARLRPHVAEQQSQVGELLPVVAGHLRKQRALAVNDLVMGKGQHEVFVEGVEAAEGELAVAGVARRHCPAH